MAKPGIKNFADSSKYEWLIIVIAIFVLRIMPWLLAEYWYDEVLTLSNFAIGTSPDDTLWKSVFRSYPIANNHILSTAVYWVWVRILNYNLGFEHFTRLPSLLFGTGLIALCVCHWRKWLGSHVANLGGLLLAASPVFGAFAYQIRGYSMSMFLTGLAISGLLEYNSGKYALGQFLMSISCLLLPLVIPSNVLLAPVLAAVLLWSCRSWKSKLISCIPPMLAFFVGISYYFTIWTQFVNASKEPGGWSSPWLVAGNLLLAFLLHGLALLIALLLRKMSLLKGNENINELQDTSIQSPAEGMNAVSPMVIFLSSALVIGLTLLFSRKGQAPYPRVFLILFITASYALLQACANNKVGSKSFPMLFIAILFCGLVTERIAFEMTNRKLQAGISPQNLLQQYYRGNSDLRNAVDFMAKNKLMEDAIILTDEYDHPTVQMYFAMNGGAASKIFTRLERSTPELRYLSHNHEGKVFYVIAKSRDIAISLLDFAEFDQKSNFNAIQQCGTRTIYRVDEVK
ncbi:MAG: hypothetical protein J5746_12455 [Victivallales bacterium]|nr:hypothetical protein [Victivallales bacterium]